MGHDDRRPAHLESVQGLLYEPLRFVVQRRRGLVEEQDRRVLQDRPGDGHALALPARQPRAPIADDRVVAVGQRRDEVVGVGGHGRGHHLIVAGVQPAVADVLRHGPAKEGRFLRHQADLATQAVDGHVADIHAIDADGPRGHVPQARDEPGERRLAGPGRSNQGKRLPRRDLQRDVTQDRPIRQICERHGVELDPAGDAGQRPGPGSVYDRGSRIDDLEDPLDRPRPLAKLPVQARDRAQARADGDAIQQEAGQRPDPERAVDHLVPGVPEQGGDGPEAEEAHQRPKARPPQGQPRPGRHHAAQVGVVALQFPVLAHVTLDHADPGQGLLRGCRTPRDGVLDLGADPLQRSTKDDRDDDQGRRQEEHHEEQRGAQREQDDHRADECDDR